MKNSVPLSSILVIIIAFFGGSEGSAKVQGDANVEAKFIKMLKNVTLKGTWAPIQQGRIGTEKGDDSYRVARVEKNQKGKWSVVYKFKMRDQQVEFPIAADVKFAGDTAVLILDNVRAGRGTANWSARVMFHEDVYVGRWWETANRKHGGTIAGIITRDPETKNTSPSPRARRK